LIMQNLLLTRVGTGFRMALTFLCVSLVWVFFRAQNFSDAISFLRGLFLPHAGKAEPMNAVGLVLVIFLITVAHMFGVKNTGSPCIKKYPRLSLGWRTRCF